MSERASSKKNLLLSRADPISNAGGASVRISLRECRKMLQNSCERGAIKM